LFLSLNDIHSHPIATALHQRPPPSGPSTPVLSAALYLRAVYDRGPRRLGGRPRRQRTALNSNGCACSAGQAVVARPGGEAKTCRWCGLLSGTGIHVTNRCRGWVRFRGTAHL